MHILSQDNGVDAGRKGSPAEPAEKGRGHRARQLSQMQRKVLRITAKEIHRTEESMNEKRSKILTDCRISLIFLIKTSWEAEQKEKSCFPRGIRYTHDRVQTCQEDYFTRTMADVADLQTVITAEQKKYRRLRMLALDTIEEVRNVRQRYVLRQYYTEKRLEDVNGVKHWTWYTLEDVALEIGTTTEAVKKIKERGILRIDYPALRQIDKRW